MNAPPFLTALLSILMLLVAGYSLWRLAVARAFGRPVDAETDLLHLAGGIAAAGMLTDRARTLPPGAWAVVFAIGGLSFAVRLARAWSGRAERRRYAALTGISAVLIYMPLAGVAPSTIHGSTAGMYTMAGMPGMLVDTTITFPSLGLLFAAALAFYAVAVLGRLGEAGADPAPALGPPAGVLAPRSVEVARIVLVLVLAYAILGKLV